MAKPKIKLNRQNVRQELLRNEDIAKLTESLANRVRDSAGYQYIVIRKNYQNRITFEVRDPRTGSMYREATSGRLTSALRSIR
jgi:hypothetical protein